MICNQNILKWNWTTTLVYRLLSGFYCVWYLIGDGIWTFYTIHIQSLMIIWYCFILATTVFICWAFKFSDIEYSMNSYKYIGITWYSLKTLFYLSFTGNDDEKDWFHRWCEEFNSVFALANNTPYQWMFGPTYLCVGHSWELILRKFIGSDSCLFALQIFFICYICHFI